MSEPDSDKLRRENKRLAQVELRKTRRASDFTEVNVWVPTEAKQQIHDLAEALRDRCDRLLPLSRNKDV